MHKYLEHYVIGKGYEDLTELGQQTKKMANKVIEVGLTPVEGYFGSSNLWYIKDTIPLSKLKYLLFSANKIVE